MGRTLPILAAVLLVFVASAFAHRSAPPAFPKLPADFTHAEINVRFGSSLHTLILDRGRIARRSPTQLTLLERDGSRVDIPLSDRTIVQPLSLSLTIDDLRRGMVVDAMRIDAGAADRVRILPGSLRLLR
jgi:hypothetical protein